jgi:SNF2 family DNA or RNA helicase
LQVLGSELATDDPAPALAARARIAHPDPPTSQPACVVGGTMRGYQVDGLQWMVRNDRSRVGGILGDEMGLGKTLQV